MGNKVSGSIGSGAGFASIFSAAPTTDAESIPREPGCNACWTPEEKEVPTSMGVTPQSPTVPVKCMAYAHSECPVNRRELGRATWAFLHTMAAYYPEKPSQRQQDEMRDFMLLMGRVYPCGYCADRTADEMEINPPRVKNQKELSRWMCEVHNEVNYRLGKPEFDCNLVEERWKYGPADGRCDRGLHRGGAPNTAQ